MTPQEKAKELVNKYLQVYDGRLPIAKQCALIAVDEILSELTEIPYGLEYLNRLNYWLEVKQEIEKL
jgi:hypothetical protein